MADELAYVFGYGSLAVSADPLVVASSQHAPLVHGRAMGFRRRWEGAMENTDPYNDHAHYRDPLTGERPDVCVVALSLHTGQHIVNGIAVPVTADRLAIFDRRELHYDRIEITDHFEPRGRARVWAYVANARARADCERARRSGRAVISSEYVRRVWAAFRDLGEHEWALFQASTDEPPFPLRELEHIVSEEP